MSTLVGPPCIHCGLVTFASPCKLLAYGLEETAIEGFAVECLMCKSKGPFAMTPEDAIQRYSPWVSFTQRKPAEDENIIVWDAEFNSIGAIRFSSAQDLTGRYDAVMYTHWTAALPGPAIYKRVDEQVPVVQPGDLVGPRVQCEKEASCILDNGHDDDCDTLPF